MKKARILFLIMACTAIVMSGCTKSTDVETVQDETEAEEEEHAVKSTVNLTEGKYSEEKLDATWDDKEAVHLTLDENGIAASDDSVRVEENTATITEEGTYVLAGTLAEGQIIVDAADQGDSKAKVKLVLNDVDITCSGSAAIYVKSGDTVITLAEGTENVLTDGAEYVFENEETDEPQAAVFAKDDLTFNGTGTLTVNGNYNHAIQSKDDLKFVTGTYKIAAVGDGIVGKDSVSIKNGNFTIEAGGDGIKSTNIEETDKGYVLIENGAFQITAANDGIQAETLLRVNDGEFEIVTGGGCESAVKSPEMEKEAMPGGGHPDGEEKEMLPGERIVDGKEMPSDGEMAEGEEAPYGGKPDDGRKMGRENPADEELPDGEAPSADMEMPQGGGRPENSTGEGANEEMMTETASTKGLKSYVEMIIAGGEFSVNSCDDALHSNKNVTINSGTFHIWTGDDGVHADEDLNITGGTIDIQQSYEGLEGFNITISGGDIKIISSDDGINAAGDDDSVDNPESDENAAENSEGEMNMSGRMNSGGGRMAGEDQGASLTIQGGTVYVNADGDGLDANGDILISGGEVIVHGPENGGNGTLDYAESCQITGGTFIGIGSVGMAQSPSEDSTQAVITQSLNQTVEAGTEIIVKDGSGAEVAAITTEKQVQWFSVSTPELKTGETYHVYAGSQEVEITAK